MPEAQSFGRLTVAVHLVQCISVVEATGTLHHTIARVSTIGPSAFDLLPLTAWSSNLINSFGELCDTVRIGPANPVQDRRMVTVELVSNRLQREIKLCI